MDCYCDLPIPIPICTALHSFYIEKSLPSYFLLIRVLYKALFSKFLNVSLLYHFSYEVFDLPSFCSSEFVGICSSYFSSEACALFTIACTLITFWSSVSQFHIRSTITIFFSILHPQHNTSQVKLAFTL